MRKFIIGIAVAGIFVVYSIGIRHQRPVIAKPASLAKGSGSASPAGSATSSASSGSNTGSSTSTNGSQTNAATTTNSHYKDGTFTGSVADAYYGQVQVAVTINGGKVTNVKFLQYPNTHSTSVYINQQAMPYLKQEAIQSQNSNVQIISGATFTSQAFIQSLSNALSKASA